MVYSVLLAAEGSIAPTIVACIVAIIIAIVAVIGIKNSIKKKEGKEAAVQFLANIQASVTNAVLNHLKTADFSKIFADTDSLLDAETALIADVYESIKSICLEKLAEQYGDDPLYDLIAYIINFEQIESFCRKIVESDKVREMISDIIKKKAEEISEVEQLEQEYTEINNQIENDTYAKPGEEVKEIDPETALGPDPWPIIPPSEDGSGDVDEVLEESTETINAASELIDNL